jgi:hypothetical protein
VELGRIQVTIEAHAIYRHNPAKSDSSVFQSFVDQSIGEAGNKHQRKSNQHAIRMPFAVVEYALADLVVALNAMVQPPQVISPLFSLAVDGISAQVQGSGKE